MTGQDKTKLKGILDSMRFDGKGVEDAYKQIESLFNKSETKERHHNESTRFFYVFMIVFMISLAFIVKSCYHSA